MKNLYLFFSLFIWGCTSNSVKINNVPLLTWENEEIVIEGEYLKDIMGIPSEMDIIQEELLLGRPFGCVLKTVNVTTLDETNCFGALGEGPFEYLSPFYAGKDEKNSNIYIWDITKGLLTKCEYVFENDSFKINPVELIKKEYTDYSYYELNYLNDQFFVAQKHRGEENTDGFLLLKHNLEIVKTFGDHPISNELNHARGMRGTISSTNNSFVFAGMDYGYIAKYDVSPTGETEKKWEYYLSEPYFDIIDGEIKWDWSKNLEGFFDIKINEKYIFALYSGNLFTPGQQTRADRKLLVLDHSGNLLKVFKLKKGPIRIAISEKNQLYTLAFFPDCGFIQYDLNSYLE